ncbi:hypothetical protein [Nocardia brasiliensis]|uniref:hypothetical protein n=1 Tax=Nocardia brasiliensis TaxID=37326 RepID=UPI0004A6CD34|nr:hypothetical protein [Nocardia brasiliensis]
MDENGLLVKVLAGISVAITVGWLVSFVLMPAIRAEDYRPQPEVAVAMTAVITSIAGLLGTAYFKARRPRDEARDEDEDAPDGDGNDH